MIFNINLFVQIIFPQRNVYDNFDDSSTVFVIFSKHAAKTVVWVFWEPAGYIARVVFGEMLFFVCYGSS